MAPRQRRISPQPSHEEDEKQQQQRPLLQQQQQQVAPAVATSAKTSVSAAKDAQDDIAAVAAAERAREQHDYFNLVALLIVVAVTLIDWDLTKLSQGPTKAWKGEYFYLNWATTCLYFLIDLVWVACIPICVKSPDVIIKHHIVAIAYLSAPLALPEYRWFMGAVLSVEINTWFLIMRRVVYKRQDQIPAFITETVSIAFYISWIIIRCFIFPAILITFLQMAHQAILETGIYWHWPMVFIPVHFFLCLLNMKWSYDLFQPIIMKWVKATRRIFAVNDDDDEDDHVCCKVASGL